MPDLKQRLDAVDQIPVDDVWPEIRERLKDEAAGLVTPLRAANPQRGPEVGWRKALTIAAVLVLVAAAGILFVRSLRSDLTPATPPEPRPAPGVSGALAYELDGDIYLADPDGSNAVKIAATGVPDEGCAGTVGYSLPSWSPDGRYLAFQRDCSRSGGSAVVITHPDGTVVAEFPAYRYVSGLAWSPDSTRVAVWETLNPMIGVYGVDGVRQASLPSPLTRTPAEGVIGPLWMPDGSALLVGDALSSLTVLPLDGSPAYELSGGLPIASPDRTRVAVIADDSTVITDADGAPVSEVDLSLHGVVWSPAGDRFASETRRGKFVVVDAATGGVTMLPGSVNGIQGFSPQGDRILYAKLVRDGGAFYNSLYSIGVDGSDRRLLVDGSMHGQWRPG
jgi:dipeptidyl aminopeptidase/acylaminoacyl peptidase